MYEGQFPKKRYQHTLRFLEEITTKDEVILDLGVPNPFSELMKKEYSSYRFYKAGIYNKPYLANSQGAYKGYPYRSFGNGAQTA